MSKEEAQKWVEALRNKETRAKWQRRTKKRLELSKKRQEAVGVALASGDPDAALESLIAENLRNKVYEQDEAEIDRAGEEENE